MDPVSALIIACVVSWYVTRGAVDAAADQARAEARHAASAIREDLQARRADWARRLQERLAQGREASPSTSALWWAWAATRAARAVRARLRQQPREAERRRPNGGGTTGPFRRIWAAGRRGGRAAWDEARRQRAGHERQTREPVGVCERCGAVVARQALAWALNRRGTQEQMCAKCRGEAEAERRAGEQEPGPPPQPGPEVFDADVVEPRIGELPAPAPSHEPATAVPTAPELPEPSAPEPPPAPPQEPQEPELPPAAPRHAPPPQPGTPTAPQVPAPAATPTKIPTIEGGPLAPRSPGLIPVRSAYPAAHAAGRSNGGESYTHGQWNRAVTDIEQRLEQLPAVLEMMMRRLTTADAGRAQVTGVLVLRDQVALFMQQVTTMLRQVNHLEQPMLRAVEAAGGPEQIAGITYLSDV